MPYQVLARAYRPRSFKEVVGQSHVVLPLQNALRASRLHHAYLFCGTRGTGKTTVARVFAKALNCLNLQAGEPCNQCEHCTEVDEGRFVDLIEIDAASKTKVEDTRSLLDNVPYKPAKGRFKIYLIDEVHMLSTHSFNALLKTLEEPPEHVKFLLCTTDPQKCPVTVLSRCLQFYLRHLNPNEIVAQMQRILEQESCPFEPEALYLIADAARGSMRDALSLLDQAINFGDNRVQKDLVLAMLGAVDPDTVFQLISPIVKGDLGAALEFLNQFASQSDAYDSLGEALLQGIHQLAMSQAKPEYAAQYSEHKQQWLKQLQSELKAHEWQLLYQFALMGQKDIQLAPSQKQGFEMLILRMMAFVPLPALDQFNHHQEKNPEPRIMASHAKAQGPAVSAVKKESGPKAETKTPVQALANPVQAAPPLAPKIQSQAEPVISNPKGASLEHKLQHLNTSNRILLLRELIEALGLSGLAKQALLHAELISVENQVVLLSLSKQYQSLLSEVLKKQIETALRKLFSPSYTLSVQLVSGEVSSPVKKEAEHRQQEQALASQSIQQDEHVQFLQKTFGATIVPGSVKKVYTQ